MAFDRPNLTQLRQQVAADINAALPGVDALLRYSNLGIVADVLAALANGHYGYLDYIAQQSVPFTATGENLEGWAALKGVTRKSAVPAIGTVTFTGTNGTVVPSGAPVNRSDGFAYLTTGSGTISGGTVTVPVQAVTAGATGNADAGTSMTLAMGISGITSVGTAATAIAGGADVESDFALRSRMLAAYSSPPQGGSYNDYAEWSLAVPGVTRVWVIPSNHGPGTIDIFFMMDAAESAHAGFPQGSNGVASGETRDTPATGDQLILANALFLKQPVTVLLYAVAPTANSVNLTINGIATASTDTKAQISAAIANAFKFGAIPGGVAHISEIELAIGNVAGTSGFVITAVTASAGTVSPGSTGNITSNAGAIPVLGTITYT